MPKCYLCLDNFPKALMHEHHKKPQGYGGVDAFVNLIWLCGGCHNHIHRISERAMFGQRGEANDIIGSVYPQPIQKSRASELVREILEAKATHDDGKGIHRDVQVTIKIPPEQYRVLKAKVMSLRTARNGKMSRVSIPSYLRSMVLQYIREKL